MKLSPIWFIEKHIDFEYQKYILLNYVNDVNSNFKSDLLYPAFEDITYHLKNIESYRTTRNIILSKSRKLKGFDFDKMTLLYDLPDESDDLKTVDEIVMYSEPLLKQSFNIGKSLYKKVYNNIIVKYVGLISNNNSKGYLLIKDNVDIKICEYDILNDISINIVDKTTNKTFEDIKLGLLTGSKCLLPSVLSAEVKIEYNHDATVLPIIKHKLMNLIGN